MLKSALAAAAALALAAPAVGQVGNAAMPIELKMKRGTDRIVVHGVERQDDWNACCTYVFKAQAGQKLYWEESGAVVRMVITYPNGEGEGPGFVNPLPLQQTGVYTLALSPDTMADGAFGPFTLTLRIPPLRR